MASPCCKSCAVVTSRSVPVIMVTAYGDSDRTIQAMRDGAFDYVTKPFDLDRLLAVVDRALEQFQLARELTPPTASPAADVLVGRERSDAGGDQGDRPRFGVGCAGPDHGRDRYRQGAGRARDPSLLEPQPPNRSSP